MEKLPEPSLANGFLAAHAALLADSFRRWTGRSLLAAAPENLGQALFHAPFALVSHDTQADPVFNYANRVALDLFEMDWAEFTRLPSRQSAEPAKQADRERLLATVSRQGFVGDYSGIRIARSGRRFRIRDTVIWNLVDQHGHYRGQAAMFPEWQAVP